jgi:hypothetical protein
MKESLIKHSILPYEVISIDNKENKYNICEAYNLGAAQSRYENLCFVHEDIQFLTSGWDLNLNTHLQKNDVALIGVLGNTIKTKFPSGVYSDVRETNRINQVQKFADGSSLHYYNNPHNEQQSEVAILDGIFLATKKTNWLKQPFDSATLKAFHGYDIDFSLAMKQLGKVLVVYDILLVHLSLGGNTKNWVESQLAISQKWNWALPVMTSDADKLYLRSKEVDDLTQLVRTLLKLKINFRLSCYYTLNLLLKGPFSRSTISIVKRLLTYPFNG